MSKRHSLHKIHTTTSPPAKTINRNRLVDPTRKTAKKTHNTAAILKMGERPYVYVAPHFFQVRWLKISRQPVQVRGRNRETGKYFF